MITAIILADDDLEALGATLASLVPAVARGLVRDAVVVDRSGRPDVGVIANAAGTAYVRIAEGDDPWRAGAGQGRGTWLLLLEAGDVPEGAWEADAERFLLIAAQPGAGSPRAAFLRQRGRGMASLVRRLRSHALWRFGPAPGLLLPRSALSETPPRMRLKRLGARLHRVAQRL